VAVARQFVDPRIRVVEGDVNRNLPTCLNSIIAQCKSRVFARMDGDDIAYPLRLEKQLEAMERNPGVDLLGGSILIFNDAYEASGFRKAAQTHAEICGPPWRVSNLPHVTWMGRSEWFKLHPYSLWASHAQDRDLLTRVRREANFAAIPDVLVGVRESKPVWRKLLASRRQMLKTAFREGVRQRDPALLLVTTTAEMMKCGLDAAATLTGLNYRLLKHRVPPVPSGLAAEWQGVLEATRARVLAETGPQRLQTA
jgi:glycosyltransferase involved in cell wall biosynthesis